ncbi:MAG: hypothetical protein J6Y28_01775 [Acholeplasmatales bacterium]|nr:hypothetical protein [Acholeplasmatales bacterium]
MKKRTVLSFLMVATAALAFTACKSKKKTTTKETTTTQSQVTTKSGATTKSNVTTSKVTTQKATTQKITTAAHVHQFETAWSTSETEHWHEATCGHDVKKDQGAHVYDDDDDTTCNVCGYVRTPNENGILFDVEDRTYNGEKQGLVDGVDFITNSGIEPTIYYKTKGADDSTYTLTEPKNAGNYTARIIVEGNALYTGIDEEVDFKIKKKELTNVYEEKEFGTNNLSVIVAGNSANTNWGLCQGDNVQINVTLAPDYGNIAYVGENKTIADLHIEVGGENYCLNNPLNIRIDVTPKYLSLAGGPINANAYNNIWLNASSSIPAMNFGFGYIGESAYTWNTAHTIEMFDEDSENWVELEGNFGQQSQFACTHAGSYHLIYTITPKENSNYAIQGSNSYTITFSPKETIAATTSSTVTLNEGDYVVYSFTAPANHLYQIGYYIDADTEIWCFNGNTGYYSDKAKPVIGNYIYECSKNIKLLIKVTANDDFVDRPFIQDLSYSDRIELTSTVTSNISTTNGAGKYIEFYFDEDRFGSGEFLVGLYHFGNSDVYVCDEGGYYYSLIDDEDGLEFIGEIWYQGGEIRIIVCLDNDLTNAQIEFVPND